MTQEELKLLHELQKKAKGLLPDAHFVEVYQHDLPCGSEEQSSDPYGLEENTNNYRLCGYHFDDDGMYRHYHLNDDETITEDEKDEWQDPTPSWDDE